MAENLVKTDPKSCFGFPACATCFAKPCERLRYGGVRPGKFIMVHMHEYSFDSCYFAAESFHEIEWMLKDLQLRDLILRIGGIIPSMSPAEQLQYNLQHYVNDYSDWAGYMAYVQRIWEDRVLIVLRIPMSYIFDNKIKRWLHALEGGVELSHKLKEDELSGKAVSDGLVDSGNVVSLDNPTWLHLDDAKRKDRSDVAMAGDEILLSAEPTGIAEGGQVAFDVFDVWISPEKKVESLSGKVESGRANAKWVVKKPEATAKAINNLSSKYSIDFSQLKCTCKAHCGGFGKQRHKGESVGAEIYNKYEYPGIHRSLLWAVRGLMFYLESEKSPELKIMGYSAGYRCHDNNAEHLDKNNKPRTSTNHMGKAVDILIESKAHGNWIRHKDVASNEVLCDKVRGICHDKFKAQIRWQNSDHFSMEPSEEIKKGEATAPDWVHLDVRQFNHDNYLQDKFFCKDTPTLNGKPLAL